MITHERERYHWEFVFLGANIDAEQTAGDFGIHRDAPLIFMPMDRESKPRLRPLPVPRPPCAEVLTFDDLNAPDFLGGVRDDYRSRRRMKW